MIGLTSVTFRKKSPEEIVRLASETGMEMIEWGGDCHVTNPQEAARVRKLCAERNLATPSFGSYFTIGRDGEDALRQVCETTCALGAKTVRVWLGTKGSADTDAAEYRELLERTVQAAECAAPYGLTLAFEFHRRTYNDTGASCLKLLSDCGRPHVRTYWQPFFEGADTENLKQVLPHVQNVHVFCWNAAGKRYRLAKGRAAWAQWISTLRGGGFAGDYILEFCRRDSARIFQKDAATLRSLIGGN